MITESGEYIDDVTVRIEKAKEIIILLKELKTSEKKAVLNGVKTLLGIEDEL